MLVWRVKLGSININIKNMGTIIEEQKTVKTSNDKKMLVIDWENKTVTMVYKKNIIIDEVVVNQLDPNISFNINWEAQEASQVGQSINQSIDYLMTFADPSNPQAPTTTETK